MLFEYIIEFFLAKSSTCLNWGGRWRMGFIGNDLLLLSSGIYLLIIMLEYD